MCHWPRTLYKRASVRLVTKLKKESGAELVEAALVIPILLMLLLGIVTFGRAWNTYQTITRAAREGAKAAVLPPCALASTGGCPGSNSPYTASNIWDNFVGPVLESAHLDPTKIANPSLIYVLLDPNDIPPHICGVRLAFDYPYTFLLPFTSVNLTTINLSAAVQMRLETQPSTCPVATDYPAP